MTTWLPLWSNVAPSTRRSDSPCGETRVLSGTEMDELIPKAVSSSLRECTDTRTCSEEGSYLRLVDFCITHL